MSLKLRHIINHRRYALLPAFCLACFFYMIGDNVASGQLELENAISVIEQFESKVGALRYRARLLAGLTREENGKWKRLEIPRTDDVPKIPEGQIGSYFSENEVVFDLKTNRYMTSATRLSKSAVKADGSRNDIFSFIFTKERYSGGPEVFKYEKSLEMKFGTAPDSLSSVSPWKKMDGVESKKIGLIAPSSQELHLMGSEALSKFQRDWGIGFVACVAQTRFSPPTRLSEYLRSRALEGDFVSIRERDALWEIYCLVHSSKVPHAVKIFFNPIRGHIDRIEFGGCSDCSKPDPDDWWIEDLILYQYGSEWRLPEVGMYINLTRAYQVGTERPVTQITYSNQEFDVAESPNLFEIEFKPGVEVSDHISKSVYVVGQGTEADVESALKFMQLHGLAADAESQSDSKGRGKIILVLMGAAVVVVFILKWYRRGGGVTSALILLMLTSLPVANAKPIEADASSEKTSIRQCGQMVAVACCGYFNVPVDINTIKDGLVPGNTLCIVCRVLDGTGHFLIVAKKPDAISPVVIDVLSSVVPIEEALSDDDLNGSNGAVLLVSRAIAKSIEPLAITPILDLGKVVVDDSSLAPNLDKVLSIANRSDRAMAFDIESSCGCMTLSRYHGIVLPKSTERIDVIISRSGWGFGDVTRPLLIRDSFGRSQSVFITGSGLKKHTKDQNLTVSKSSVIASVGRYDCLESMKTTRQSFSVHGSPQSLDNLTVKCNSDWIEIDRKNLDDQTVEIGVQINPTLELFECLSKSGRQCQAGQIRLYEIMVKAPWGGEKISVPVSLARREKM